MSPNKMEFLTDIFNTFLYQPLFNALVLLYFYLKDFGLAIIALTILIRIVFYPLTNQATKSQKAMQDLQPKIKEIQKQYKDDKERQSKEIMQLYQKEKINPFGGCLPLLFQLPILIALYRVFWHGFQPEAMSMLYGFVPNPGAIDPVFLGFLNLANPNFFVALLAAIAQFFQSKMMMPAGKQQADDKGAQFSNIMQKQMLYFFPFFTLLILLGLPSAVGVYWLVGSLFSMMQQRLLFKNNLNQ